MNYLIVAKTILAQLGGNRFRVMTGARGFAGTENSLTFRFPGSRGGINAVRVTLNGLDLYNVIYWRVRGTKIKTVAESSGLYADMLQDDFTEKTGLETSLGTCGATEKREG